MKIDWNKFKDVVNIGGSVASITGISLLWLNQLTPSINLLKTIPFIIVAVLFTIGGVTFLVYDFRQNYPENENLSEEVIYICFKGGLLILIVFGWLNLLFFHESLISSLNSWIFNPILGSENIISR
jgi:hypothetical protein